MASSFWPIGLLFIVAVGFAVASLLMSRVLSPRRRSSVKAETYESGITPIGPAQRRLDIRYYTTAMLFVLFDIEAVFLYPWAVVYDRLGAYGLIEMLLFMLLLVVAYAYAWRKGALDWNEQEG